MPEPSSVSPSEAVELVRDEDSDLVPFKQKKVEDELERDHLFAVIEADERQALQDMRGQWSKWILWCIVSIVIFDFFVVINVGYGWMKFSGAILPIFLGESIIKVIGLAIIIVGFLFSEKSFINHNGKD